jgi:hypothetical protein
VALVCSAHWTAWPSNVISDRGSHRLLRRRGHSVIVYTETANFSYVVYTETASFSYVLSETGINVQLASPVASGRRRLIAAPRCAIIFRRYSP